MVHLLGMILRAVLFLAILATVAAACVYLYRRLVRDVGLSVRTRRFLQAALAALTLLCVAALVLAGA